MTLLKISPQDAIANSFNSPEWNRDHVHFTVDMTREELNWIYDVMCQLKLNVPDQPISNAAACALQRDIESILHKLGD
jgi:hypothetical protein